MGRRRDVVRASQLPGHLTTRDLDLRPHRLGGGMQENKRNCWPDRTRTSCYGQNPPVGEHGPTMPCSSSSNPPPFPRGQGKCGLGLPVFPYSLERAFAAGLGTEERGRMGHGGYTQRAHRRLLLMPLGLGEILGRRRTTPDGDTPPWLGLLAAPATIEDRTFGLLDMAHSQPAACRKRYVASARLFARRFPNRGWAREG